MKKGKYAALELSLLPKLMESEDDTTPISHPLTRTQYQIVGQINIAIRDLGGSEELMALVGSFGQSQQDDDVLDMIEEYNAFGTYLSGFTEKG